MSDIEITECCPYCGSRATQVADVPFVIVKKRTVKAVVCCACAGQGPIADDEDRAVTLWNRRVQGDWRNFANERPADGQSCIVWIANKVARKHAIAGWDEHRGIFNAVTHEYNPTGADILWCMWMPDPAPPSADEIERAVKGER